jgi:prephenate dehydrogenase
MRIGILGHGRFGRAIAGLIAEAGLEHRAFDPDRPPPDGIRVESVEAAVDRADIVLVAVPVPQIASSLEALAPHASPSSLVLDVGSVKVGPEAAFERVLGARIPWIATHPLFGPAALARGERPLRVALCPNPRHPDALARARAFFDRIGCTTFEVDAETHDRVMADTHALAFFVAKALMDMGIGDHALAPPSFQAMARTIEAVRSDAGHLFLAIQKENEFAATARRRLIDALENLDEQIRGPVGPAPIEPKALAIPDLGARAPDLVETRELIDEVDKEIVSLLARRATLSLRARRAKGSSAIRDPGREQTVLEERSRWAAALGLDPSNVRELFETILRHSRRMQRTEAES